VLVERERQQGRRRGRLAVRVEAPVVRVNAFRGAVGRLAAMPRLVVLMRRLAMPRLAVVVLRLAVMTRFVTVRPNPLPAH